MSLASCSLLFLFIDCSRVFIQLILFSNMVCSHAVVRVAQASQDFFAHSPALLPSLIAFLFAPQFALRVSPYSVPSLRSSRGGCTDMRITCLSLCVIVMDGRAESTCSCCFGRFGSPETYENGKDPARVLDDGIHWCRSVSPGDRFFRASRSLPKALKEARKLTGLVEHSL